MARHFAELTKTFRSKFTVTDAASLVWYPGHMKRGLDQIHSNLRYTDAVLEVHDARIPFSGRHPELKNILHLRPHLLILNKQDLADSTREDEITKKLKQNGVDNVLYMNCSSDRVIKHVKKDLVPLLLEEIERKPRYRRGTANEFNIMVIGVPNVGKSTLLNKLRQAYTQKRKGARVGADPGVTRAVMNKVRVSFDPDMFVVDTPGILSPKIPDVHTGMRLVLCGCLPSHLVGEEDIVDYLLFWLNTHQNFSYMDMYNMNKPTDDIYEFLSCVAKHRRLAVRVGSHTYATQQDQETKYKLNLSAAAASVIKDFQYGLFGKVLLDDDKLNF